MKIGLLQLGLFSNGGRLLWIVNYVNMNYSFHDGAIMVISSD